MAARRMVEGMLPPPVMVGSEGERPGDKSPEIVGSSGFENRSVSTVMKDDEDPDEQSPGENRQGYGQQPRDRKA